MNSDITITFTTEELKHIKKSLKARIKRAQRVIDTYDQIKDDDQTADGLADEWLDGKGWGDYNDLMSEIWKMRETRTKIESLKD